MKCLRRVGQGDLQHVRSLVLQVALFDPEDAVLNAAAAFNLGSRLSMMTRLHVNMKVMSPAVQTELLNLYFRNTQHQMEAWDLSDEELKEKLVLCDLIIQGPSTQPRLEEREGDVVLSQRDPIVGMELAWKNYNGRFLNGNHGRRSIAELLDKHAYPVPRIAR